MNITDHLYVGAEAAMSIALAGVSRPDGIKRLFIVFWTTVTGADPSGKPRRIIRSAAPLP